MSRNIELVVNENKNSFTIIGKFTKIDYKNDNGSFEIYKNNFSKFIPKIATREQLIGVHIGNKIVKLPKLSRKSSIFLDNAFNIYYILSKISPEYLNNIEKNNKFSRIYNNTISSIIGQDVMNGTELMNYHYGGTLRFLDVPEFDSLYEALTYFTNDREYYWNNCFFHFYSKNGKHYFMKCSFKRKFKIATLISYDSLVVIDENIFRYMIEKNNEFLDKLFILYPNLRYYIDEYKNHQIKYNKNGK